MPLPPRLFTGDEELGKKDDEYKPGKHSRIWKQRGLPHPPHRRSVKRVAWSILVLMVVYYFYRRRYSDNLEDLSTIGNGDAFKENLPVDGKREKETHKHGPAQPERTFNGPIKFFELASTLRSAAMRTGSGVYNQNILFAAASLKSAAILLPIACEMAIQSRNDVHFAFMGRDDIPMDMLKSVNGITADCKMMFHDARPDFALKSTDFRMEVSCSAAFNHITTFVHPQATLIDNSGLEELYFLKGIKQRADYLDATVIELPEDTEQNLMWITLLDSASLAAWNKVTIDLVIHAQPSASGSLLRLLESLKKAEYFSSTPPRLTIELPHKIDVVTKEYLHGFKWPPFGGQGNGNLLTLHHRIPQHGLTGEENSIRFLESFWPADPANSHIMLLSPQAELSPLFFHYLKYAMLEYRYSGSNYDTENLLGISLELPSTYLNDSTTFKPPTNGTAAPFLWQAPNSNAALYFGDRWVEIHGFVSNLLISQRKLPTPTTLNEKHVSKTYPSWLEHVLKLARSRGYAMVYPNFEATDSLVTLHNDLYQPPEEYKHEKPEAKKEKTLGGNMKDHLSLQHKERPLARKGLLSILSEDGRLPFLSDMPIAKHDGEVVDVMEMRRDAGEFMQVFRREIGGCTENDMVVDRTEDGVEDLFCLDDMLEEAA